MRGVCRLALLILLLCVTGGLRAYTFANADYKLIDFTACDMDAINIEDPFPIHLSQSFTELQWLRVLGQSIDGPDEQLAKFNLNGTNVAFQSLHERAFRYDYWGLSLKNQTQADEGFYLAVLKQENGTMERAYVVSIPRNPPGMKGSRIGIIPMTKYDGTIEVVCGPAVYSWGDPRIEMIFVLQNGTRVPGTYTKEGVSFIFDKQTAKKLKQPEEAVSIQCQVDEKKPSINFNCIEISRWKAKHTFAERDRTNHSWKLVKRGGNEFLMFVKENRVWVLLALTIVSAFIIMGLGGNYSYITWKDKQKRKNGSIVQEEKEVEEEQAAEIVPETEVNDAESEKKAESQV